MILLTLLACADTWTGEGSVIGPEMTLDADTPELIVSVQAELIAATGRRTVYGGVEAGVSASWEGGGTLRAFWRGPDYTPQPAEGEGSLELGALDLSCDDDGYLRCTLEGEVVFEHFGLAPVTITPELWMNGDIYRPSLKRVEHAELVGAWGDPEQP